MRVIFDGKILNDRMLLNVQATPSETEGKWDAVSNPGAEDAIVLKTFDTQADAKTYINGISDKLIAIMGDEIIDAR